MSSEGGISVIISTYNSPGYLNRVLQGYCSQSRYPDELIVADDGSTEETAQVVTQYIRTAPFTVRHVWHEDQGFRLAEIRNRAIAVATAEYLIFSDGDCIPHPRYVEDHWRAKRKGHFITGKRMLVGKVHSSNFAWSGTGALMLSCLKGGLSGCHHLIRIPWMVQQKQGLNGLRGCNLAMFRSDLLAVNGFNELITGWGREDSELVARLFSFGLKRLETPFSAIVFHLWHPENSRSRMAENDRLLEEAICTKHYRCSLGIAKDISLVDKAS
jgi:glycosyltransferase involved in cell wall biosynthesis